LIGKTAVFEEQVEPHIFASFILRIRCGEVRTHNVFLSYLMNYYREQGVFIKLSRRAVNQANYNRNEISVLAIPVPPFDEQHEIADAITTVVKVRRIHVRRRDALQVLFRALLHQLVTAQIRVHDLDLTQLSQLSPVDAPAD
jgi:type I restriction enzyme, S subunit